MRVIPRNSLLWLKGAHLLQMRRIYSLEALVLNVSWMNTVTELYCSQKESTTIPNFKLPPSSVCFRKEFCLSRGLTGDTESFTVYAYEFCDKTAF